MKLLVAPMQGYTDAPFCRYHSDIYGSADVYFTPFIRMEKGEARRRDLRNITSPLVENIRLVPQIIFRDIDEFRILRDAVVQAGYREMDMNLGCPFPPQVNHGRGAALLRNPRLLEEVSSELPECVKVSAKMRLGVERPDEWRAVADVINSMPLSHVTVHPRVAIQRYEGELYMDECDAFVSQSAHPVVFNGDVKRPEDLTSLVGRYPQLAGIMAGRGILARPSLFAEWRQGREWPREERLAALMRLHQALYAYYRETLCGQSQILMKVKPFWEYLEEGIGHKAAKAIKKASSLVKYEEAVRSVR